jgi:hypothetical protein
VRARWHHYFGGFPPFVRWVLIQEYPRHSVVASGWSLTKSRAWDASLAALPPPANRVRKTVEGLPPSALRSQSTPSTHDEASAHPDSPDPTPPNPA